MTGWGRLVRMPAVKYDLNYISITGALHAIGNRDKPVPPLASLEILVAFFYLAMGIWPALSRRRIGKGQVIDAAMTDGSASLMSFMALLALGFGMTS